MYDQICEADYAMWCHRSLIADCLAELKMFDLAKKATKAPANISIFNRYLAIIQREAAKLNNSDVIERLAYHNLLVN